MKFKIIAIVAVVIVMVLATVLHLATKESSVEDGQQVEEVQQ